MLTLPPEFRANSEPFRAIACHIKTKQIGIVLTPKSTGQMAGNIFSGKTSRSFGTYCMKFRTQNYRKKNVQGPNSEPIPSHSEPVVGKPKNNKIHDI